jgi:hypothetical protein
VVFANELLTHATWRLGFSALCILFQPPRDKTATPLDNVRDRGFPVSVLRNVDDLIGKSEYGVWLKFCNVTAAKLHQPQNQVLVREHLVVFLDVDPSVPGFTDEFECLWICTPRKGESKEMAVPGVVDSFGQRFEELDIILVERSKVGSHRRLFCELALRWPPRRYWRRYVSTFFGLRT